VLLYLRRTAGSQAISIQQIKPQAYGDASHGDRGKVLKQLVLVPSLPFASADPAEPGFKLTKGAPWVS
jgi:hypothetical protein